MAKGRYFLQVDRQEQQQHQSPPVTLIFCDCLKTFHNLHISAAQLSKQQGFVKAQRENTVRTGLPINQRKQTKECQTHCVGCLR